ncbi:hypothetical protein VTJ49DRAFT_3330 [Mycothermus thermophilus]|uniref:DNA replication regulator Sld3 C-terminal domain-containing protein n=1 Tax=Humicola insolens TaxID=85995 RepID=A0ABR3VPZ3_HUMIN
MPLLLATCWRPRWSSSITVKPRILHPLMLLPRENLPLSALDLTRPHGDLPDSRLYESKIKILDLEGRLGSNVLLARSETARMVFAVERESSGLYVLCKLGSWVDIENLTLSATVVCWDRIKTTKPVKKEEDAGPLPITTPSLYNANKRRRLAIDELVRKRPATAVEKESPSQATTATEETPGPKETTKQETSPEQPSLPVPPPEPVPSEPHRADTPANAPEPTGDPLAPPNADEIFQNIRAQYMDALYHSKGSLAYFAKGPLSRARAAFHIDWEGNLDMNDLIEFLKSLVMTTIVIDKKYRETIPEIVARMKTLVQESDGGGAKPKKRKPKKPKLGKDGLYPGEIDHIRRWWSSHQPVSNTEEDAGFTPAEHRYHISYLRRRETQLQMILILEILALEPLALAKGIECELPGTETQDAPREESQEPPTKKRNKHNLPMLLDVHADRLCIWQSTTLDEVKVVAEAQVPAEGAEGEKPEKANSDPLRDFCVDIIMPFFSARLPSICETLNRKLGGPVAQSPPKEKKVKPLSAVKPKPGAPVKRPSASKRDKDRTLERALSVERSRRSVSQGPSAAIALLRSASQTVIPGLKRESSESSLLRMLPRADKDAKDSQRRLFSRSTSLSSADLKAQKKAQVEAELKDAISALKKPNRLLAVKDLVEAAEKRSSAGQLKKMKKPNRASGVTVKATPVNNRYKDALAAEPAARGEHPTPTPRLDVAPPSSASVIPASTLPRKFANRLSKDSDRIQATPARGGLAAVEETPRPGGPDTGAGTGAGVLPSSPIMFRKAAPAGTSTPALSSVPDQQARRAQFLSIPRDDFIPSSPGLGTLFETPLAPRVAARDRFSGAAAAAVVDDTPIKSRLPLGTALDGGNRGGNLGGAVKEKVLGRSRLFGGNGSGARRGE